MKRQTLLTIILLFATVLLGSCEKDISTTQDRFSFNATIEQLGNQQTGTKTYLVDERWTYWEIYDQINIASNQTTSSGDNAYDPDANFADLVNADGADWENYNGVFITSLPENSKYFLGLFPRNNGNLIYSTGGTNFYAKINLANEQPLRSDITFARNVFPMVAWYGGEWDEAPHTPFNLDFHSLAGIVRLQFFNSSTTKTIDRIEVTSLNGKQLAGPFEVIDYNTYSNVRLEPMANTAANQKIILSCAGGLPFNSDSLRTFYLVLPATKTMHDSTVHRLQIKIIATDNTQCVQNCVTYVRRNGITYMRALGITAWNAGNGNSTPGLVGNGTADRPFKIYSVDELVYLRDAFNNTSPVKINNRTVTADTYFQIMRSNLTLNTANWDASIRNFKGHLTYSGTNTSNPVIINNSNIPVFESVTANGEVRNITLSRTISEKRDMTGNISFFCDTNRGTLSNCNIRGSFLVTTNSTDYGLGGVCIQNYGTMYACGSTATFACDDGSIGGVCFHNHSTGVIDACYSASSMDVGNCLRVSGVCYNNEGTVKDSYFASRINASTVDWAGVVFTNSGLVKHCYSSGTANIYTTASVSGIVNTNNATGVVDYCWSSSMLQGSVVGSVTAYNSGTVSNCYVNDPLASITITSGDATHCGGGLVGQLKSGGEIHNSFVYMYRITKIAYASHIGGLVGIVQGGTIDNCYAYEIAPSYRAFYGNKTGGTITNSHLVGGSSESGITGVSLGANNIALNNNLSTLKNNLSANHGTYYDWVKVTPANPSTTVTVPTLSSYNE